MAQTVQNQWQFALRVERELQALLKNKTPLFDDVEHLMDQLRIACESVLFLDFDYATAQKVEAHLWDAHSTINNRYRKIAASFKTRELQKHIVEKRKLEKRYVDFLKKSQFFYKGYIQRLASHFVGLEELRKIAHRLQLSTLTADERVHVSPDTSARILLSCHTTLLRLGDLSRYRNALRTRDRSWDKALAYYGLANDLCPDSGDAFGQMAIISLSEADHLNAVYHLYRALAVKEPNPMSQGNLAIEFKKINSEWQSGGSKAASGGSGKPSNVASPLISWFIRLHAKLYKGEEFSGHDELENEVLGQLTVLLKEQSLEGILDRFVLINIAAEYFAAERLKANPITEHFQSYYFFLRLNIRTLFMLFQLLQTELARSNEGDEVPDVTSNKRQSHNESITAVTRRILASVRQYSIWLVSSAVIISGQGDNTPLNIHIKELWSVYCSTLTLLVAAFPPDTLPAVDYLLEEDGDTVGFVPFRNTAYCDPYTNEDGLKPRTTDPGVERQHPNIEMLSRIRDLLRDAMILSTSLDQQKQKISPIGMVQGEFHFLEDGLPLSSPISCHSLDQHVLSVDTKKASNVGISVDGQHLEPRAPSPTASDSHQSMSTELYRMVDDLVAPRKAYMNGSDETSYGMHSSTAAEVFPTIDAGGRSISHHSTPAFTSLSGIFRTPFSPLPGELSTTSANQPNTVSHLSNLRLSTSQAQMDHPPALDHGVRGNLGGWNRELPPIESLQQSSPQPQINDQLSQSLARQYGLPSSSIFAPSSSIYAGTPCAEPRTYHPPDDLSYKMSNNASTRLVGTSNFERDTMLQSSIWNGSQPADWTRHVPTPPGGQGG